VTLADHRRAFDDFFRVLVIDQFTWSVANRRRPCVKR
jgi:hypothetical protein